MLSLKTIEFSNFLSYGSTPTKIDLSTSKSWILTGANGSGKSTVVEALHYAFFGRPYREINNNELVNNINKRKLSVKVTFEKSGSIFEIERTQVPNDLKLSKNGEVVKEGISKTEFQKEIQDIIGIDNKVFNQLVLIDNKFHKPFMELTPYERRGIVDSIFGLDRISLMSEKGKEYKSKTQNKITDLKSKIDLIGEKIKLNKTFNENSKNEKIQKLEEEFDVLCKEQESYNTSKIAHSDMADAITVDEEIQKIKDFELLEEEQRKLLAQTDYESRKLSDAIKLHKQGKCDKCGHAFENPEEEIREMELLLNNLGYRVVDITTELERIKIEKQNIIDEKEVLLKEKNNSYYTIKHINERLESIRESKAKTIQRINELKAEYAVSDDIKTLESQLESEERTYKISNVMFNKVKIVETILSDKGIRAYIIKKYLPVLNSSIKKYLTLMDSQFTFEFDENFNQIINEKLRNQVNYGGLSIGQKFRVNFAIIFAFIDFAEKKHNTRFDFLLLDEVLENGADNSAKESVINILKYHFDKRLIVISHDSLLNTYFDKTLKFQLKSSFSQMIEE